MSVRIMLVDDEELIRSGLRAILEAQPDIQIIGEARNSDEAVGRLDSLLPQVVVLNVPVPDAATVRAVRDLSRSGCGGPTRVLVLTTGIGEHNDELLQAGVGGVVLKRATPEELVAAVRVAAAGYLVLPPTIAHTLVSQLPTRAKVGGLAAQRLTKLSSRESEVLRLMVHGYSNGESARLLHVSESTVKSHVRRLLGKLALRDRTHAVIYAYETGFIRPGTETTALGDLHPQHEPSVRSDDRSAH